MFGVTKGKLLGHIVSKEAVKIDPKRVVDIVKVPKPKTIKEIQSLFSQVNFLRRFITKFVEIS